MVWHLVRLGPHNNLSVRIYFEHITTTLHIGRRFMKHRQADQTSAEIRGTRARSNFSAREAHTWGIEHSYVYSVLAGLPIPLN